MLSLSEVTVTLVAAGIAAAVSVATLLVTVVSSRRSEQRAAHRATLAPYLPEIAGGIHSVMASSQLLLRRAESGQTLDSWIQRGAAGAAILKDVRLKVKYSLFGTDEALRTLSRMPEWIATYSGHRDAGAGRLLENAQRLSRFTDEVVRRSYANGRPPTWFERRKLDRLAAETRDEWARRFPTIGSEPA
jgi:hypothetical protein